MELKGTFGRMRVIAIAIICAILPGTLKAQTPLASPTFAKVAIGDGITLHYVEGGHGTPLVFVHGSLSDYDYWSSEVPYFSRSYRAIAYSRRYDYPNSNPARLGYCAVVDADDLAAFITKLGLGKVNVVGHSYGALTALFLAQKHPPELVRTLVLAEPPAISLLATMPGDDAAKGKAMFADIQRHVVAPMRVAFSHGDREAGVATFIDYVFGDAAAWQKMSPSSRKATMRDAHEWDVMMTTGTLFPALDPSSVRHIMMPVLLLSGAKTYPFLRLIDEDLAHLLPDNRNFVLSKSGHQMWYQQTADTRGAVEAFLRVHGRGEAAISP